MIPGISPWDHTLENIYTEKGISIIQVWYIIRIVLLCFEVPVTTENLNLYKLTIRIRICLTSLVYVHLKQSLRMQ